MTLKRDNSIRVNLIKKTRLNIGDPLGCLTPSHPVSGDPPSYFTWFCNNHCIEKQIDNLQQQLYNLYK